MTDAAGVAITHHHFFSAALETRSLPCFTMAAAAGAGPNGPLRAFSSARRARARAARANPLPLTLPLSASFGDGTRACAPRSRSLSPRSGQRVAGAARPGDVRPDRAREGAPVPQPRAHRERELHEPRRDGVPRLGADEQVLRGPAARALLRRQRVHRPDRGAVPAARARRLPPRPQGLGRERAALLGLAGQLRRLHGAAAPARPHHGPRPAERRPPHARLLHVQQGREHAQGRQRHLRLL